MKFRNQADRIRRTLMARISHLVFTGELVEKIDRIPLEMFPRHAQSVRCCVHKDRAVIRNRIRALLGFAVEGDDIETELRPLSSWASEARELSRAGDPVLTVNQEACSSCPGKEHRVSDVCRGCMARSCQTVCPRNAVSFSSGRASIDTEKCVNCGLCLKSCPYNAIVYIPLPCEDACPVGALSKDESGREMIDHDLCISCGKCVRACPFGAVMERSDIVRVAESLRNGASVCAMTAPASSCQFPEGPGAVYAALRQLGFSRVEEVALGAVETAEREADEFFERNSAGEPFMTTSCCPAFVNLANRHIPALVPRISHTPSPMALTAMRVKRDDPSLFTVFISPCIAKRTEALRVPEVDAILTVEELGALLMGADIDLASLDPSAADSAPAGAEAWNFARTGGVAHSVVSRAGQLSRTLNTRVFDGIDRKTLNQLKVLEKTVPAGTLVEVMACQGGCLGGPVTLDAPERCGKHLPSVDKVPV